MGGKGGRCVGLTTLPPSCADCLEIWEPEPPGTLWACPGLKLDSFTFYCLPKFGPGYCRYYSDLLLAGWSGDQIPVGIRFSAHIPTSPAVLLYRGKAAGAWR